MERGSNSGWPRQSCGRQGTLRFRLIEAALTDPDMQHGYVASKPAWTKAVNCRQLLPMMPGTTGSQIALGRSFVRNIFFAKSADHKGRRTFADCGRGAGTNSIGSALSCGGRATNRGRVMNGATFPGCRIALRAPCEADGPRARIGAGNRKLRQWMVTGGTGC
jgi:hypothetical protein